MTGTRVAILGVSLAGIVIYGCSSGLPNLAVAKSMHPTKGTARIMQRDADAAQNLKDGYAIWEHNHDFKGAEAKYQAAISLSPHSFQGKEFLANLYYEAGQTDKALQTFQEFFSKDNHSSAVFDLLPNYRYAQLCRKKGLPEQEYQSYARIASAQWFTPARTANGSADSETMALVHLRVGEDLLSHGRKIEASQEFLDAYDCNPTTPEFVSSLAQGFMEVGDKPKAVQLFKKIYATSRSNEQRQVAWNALYSMGVVGGDKGGTPPPHNPNRRPIDVGKGPAAQVPVTGSASSSH